MNALRNLLRHSHLGAFIEPAGQRCCDSNHCPRRSPATAGPDVSAWKVGDRVSASPAFSIKDYANFAETALLPERVLLADTRQFYGGSSFRVQLRLLHRLRSVGIRWAGQFEYLQAAEKRLAVLIPFTLLITFVLIYMNTRSVTKTLIVLLAVPFSRSWVRSGHSICSVTT
jgi:hypothetical protein